MPAKGRRTSDREARIALVKELFGELGFSAGEIARAVGTNDSNIANDAKELGGTKAFPNRPAGKERFAVAFKRYAELEIRSAGSGLTSGNYDFKEVNTEKGSFVVDRRDGKVIKGKWHRIGNTYHFINQEGKGTGIEVQKLTDYEAHIHGVLKKLLDIDKLLTYIAGIVDTINTLRRSWYYPEDEKYAKLFRAVFGEKEHSVQWFWHEYLWKIVDAKVPVPQSEKECLRGATSDHIRATRYDVVAEWSSDESVPEWSSSEIAKSIDEAFAMLAEREEQAVRAHFGIGAEKKTPYELADMWEVTRVRVDQIFRKALRKLRHPSRSRSLEPYQEAIATTIRRLSAPRECDREKLAQRAKAAEQTAQQSALEDEARIRGLLHKDVNELMLSVRAANCLKNANIKTLEELVQKTEWDLLKGKNFGRKSLNEIKGLLFEMGLSLGMGLKDIFPSEQQPVP